MFFFIRRRRRKRKPLTAEQAAEVERLRIQAKAALPPRLAELAARHGFTYNQVRIKHNVSNWGSCSELGNINLNLNIMRLPEHLQDYIMLHELCHFAHRNHGKEFVALLDRFMPNWREVRAKLNEAPLDFVLEDGTGDA